MKNVKRIASLLLALVMVLSLAVSASADEVDVSSHTFKAYQIFSGSQATDGGPLGNVEWGSGVNGDALLAALKADETLGTTFDDCESAADVAAVLAGYNGQSDVAKTFARLAYANKKGEGQTVVNGDNIAAGYYLIVDETTLEDGADDVLNLSLLEISTTVTIESKVEKPTSQKKVIDTNDSTGETSTWQDSADHDIGDTVSFQLTATLPGDLENYNKYYLAFHEEQSDGLTFNSGSVVVKLNGVAIATSLYEVETSPEDGCTFEVIITDVCLIPGVKADDVITVEYTSTLNENAVLGSTGNPNEMHIEYSNNPNQEWNGEGKPDTGKTPDDKVIVFTYQTIVNKVNEKQEALTGAAFKLEKLVKGTDGTESWETVKEFTVDEENPASTFTFTGLDDGTYKLTETVTPAGYNTIDPITFTISATHSEEAAEPILITLTVDNKDFTVEGTTDAETGTVTPNGTVSTNVVNKAGATLPETGGMGTTMFYIFGGIMVLAAVVLLVTKKRMGAAE